jgi:hypothetical protein
METGETDLKREKNEDEKREKSASISMILQLNWPDIYIFIGRDCVDISDKAFDSVTGGQHSIRRQRIRMFRPIFQFSRATEGWPSCW